MPEFFAANNHSKVSSCPLAQMAALLNHSLYLDAQRHNVECKGKVVVLSDISDFKHIGEPLSSHCNSAVV